MIRDISIPGYAVVEPPSEYGNYNGQLMTTGDIDGDESDEVIVSDLNGNMFVIKESICITIPMVFIPYSAPNILLILLNVWKLLLIRIQRSIAVSYATKTSMIVAFVQWKHFHC